jgi:site-specific DNA-adenine methylase
MSVDLRAPFPYYGGKATIADLVWSRLGNVPNLVDPFCGSLAILLGRPGDPGIETVNDIDGMICNFWRALQADPDGVAEWADNPVNECDLHARHAWLVTAKPDMTTRLMGDPLYYDTKIAGWWVWGISCCIAGGWCSGEGPWQSVDGRLVKAGGGDGVQRKLPHLSTAGQGVNRTHNSLQAYLRGLADRLRNVRVCCGDWSRVCGPSVTVKNGLTGVFLDPPYADTAKRDPNLYAHDSSTVAHDVREWAIANGDNHLLRICLCGYEGEHEMPDTWECVPWKANGGYASQGDGSNLNKHKERCWFSPHCIKAELF